LDAGFRVEEREDQLKKTHHLRTRVAKYTKVNEGIFEQLL